MSDNTTYGLAADFENPLALMKAAEKCRDEGFKSWDCITPFPVHGLDDAMGLKRSKVPFFTFIGGAVSRCAALEFAKAERPGLFEAAGFALRHFRSFLTAPLLPLGLVGVFAWRHA